MNAPAEIWVVLDEDGQFHFAEADRDTCHARINEAIMEGDTDAAKLVVRRYVIAPTL